jgi:MerR family mercuric resistance operon transcriptional regulator
MTIGQLAEAAGVNVETVRYYQRRGLMPTPIRPLGGQRRYPAEALRQINFIRRAQDLGFTLEEITTLLAVALRGDWREARAFADRKKEELASRVAQLNRMRRQLRSLVRRCDERRGREPSPLVSYLYGEDEAPGGD